MKHAADIRAGIAGRKVASTARVLDAEIPALLRKGAPEALGAQHDFERDILTNRKHGVRVLLRVN